MKTMRYLIAIVSMLCLGYGSEGLAGFYKTHIGSDGRQSIVEFFHYEGKYYAYGFANIDGSPAKKDSNNKNPKLRERYDRGTIFVYGLEGEGSEYKGGRVYHFRTGEIYHAKVRLESDTLILRGSVDRAGIVGSSKVWTRLSEQEVRPYLHLKPPMEEVLSSLKDWNEL
ncbi:DUF2147 domain-containing protein [uncultured Helicobacter sp.]|uniref:DUF2147 domain-containing protein n=1 Tax=uncultured Helicobacter sp. TaxID=175537 RepID=UPI00374ED761